MALRRSCGVWMGLKFKKISFSLLKLLNFAKGYPKYLDPKIVFTIGKSTEGYQLTFLQGTVESP